MKKKESLKILVATGIYPPSIGGPATYTKLLEDELPKRGIDVSVATFDSVRKYPKIIRHILFFFLVIWKSRGCKIIYAQDPVSVGLPALLASRLLFKKFVLKIVGDYAWEQGKVRFNIKYILDDFWKNKESHPWPVKFLMSVERFVASHSSMVIVPSFYLKKIVSDWGINEKRINVVYNAFDIGDFDGISDIRFSTSPNIVSIGRLVPWKGFASLIEVVSKLSKKFPSIGLYIIGDGPMKKNLQEVSKMFNADERVFFTGSLSKKETLANLHSADIFILNTSYEGFSHTLLEAMALQVPIITTPVGGNLELVEDNKNGLLIPYNNVKAISEAIEKLILRNDLRDLYIKNGKEKVLNFSKEVMINNICKLLT